MISSSPPAHASTRETHLRRCSSHPPLRLRSCPPRQRKQVASEGLRGARVCPQLTSNSRAGDTQDGARSSKNLDGCTRASPRPSQFATAAQKRALPWSTAAQPEQQRCDCEPACPQTSDRGQVRNVADRRSRVGGAAAGHHVLIRIRRWKEGRPLADSHKAWLMQAGFAASLPYRRLKQRAQGTAATASVSAVPASSAEPLEPEAPAQRLWREAP